MHPKGSQGEETAIVFKAGPLKISAKVSNLEIVPTFFNLLVLPSEKTLQSKKTEVMQIKFNKIKFKEIEQGNRGVAHSCLVTDASQGEESTIVFKAGPGNSTIFILESGSE